MQIIKPHWVSHDGMPIFSLDIHPDNSRFVTGGQGKDSGLVVIWNIMPIISQEVEQDENVPKMLCQIDSHLACVNCVRWSTSGKYLASAGDDKLVMIWKLTKYPQVSKVCFGSKGKVNSETWRCINTLRAHSGDILDMAWSPEDVWLATASVDNTVVVWDANKLPSIVAILKGHTGLVKGVTWDPIGKYLSSQSEDKSLRIWRTFDWKLETVIKKPFENCSGTTAVLRHSWSPDGQYLVTAHAMNQNGPTSQIIERDGWKYDKDYVGHRKAITCAKFSNNIFQKKLLHNNKLHPMCVCALGSRDSGISVWLTGLFRPIVVMEDIFQGPILDLSWSSNGNYLFACSFDGSVATMLFDELEIGKPLTRVQKNELYEKMYGTSSIRCNKGGAHIIENPDLLPILEEYEKREKKEDIETNLKLTISKSIPCRIMTKQIETRTADGKRRITPIYIPPIDEDEQTDEVKEYISKTSGTNVKDTEITDSIFIKKHSDIEPKEIINEANNKINIQESNAESNFNRLGTTVNNGEVCNIDKSILVISEPQEDINKFTMTEQCNNQHSAPSLPMTERKLEKQNEIVEISNRSSNLEENLCHNLSNMTDAVQSTLPNYDSKSVKSYSLQISESVLEKGTSSDLEYEMEERNSCHSSESNNAVNVSLSTYANKEIFNKQKTFNSVALNTINTQLENYLEQISTNSSNKLTLTKHDTSSDFNSKFTENVSLKEVKSHSTELTDSVKQPVDFSCAADSKKTLNTILKLAEDSSASITITPIYASDKKQPNDLPLKSHDKTVPPKRKISGTILTLSDDSPVSITLAGNPPMEKKIKISLTDGPLSVSKVCTDSMNNTSFYKTEIQNKTEMIKEIRNQANDSDALDKEHEGNSKDYLISAEHHSIENAIPNMEVQSNSIVEKADHNNDAHHAVSKTTSDTTLHVKVLNNTENDLLNNSETNSQLSSKFSSENNSIYFKRMSIVSNNNSSCSKTSTPPTTTEKFKFTTKRPSNAAVHLLAVKQPKFMEKIENLHNRQELKNVITESTPDGKRVSLPQMCLNIPTTITVKDEYKLIISSEVGFNTNNKFYRVKMKNNNNLLWEYAYGYTVIGYAFNDNTITIALDNRNIYIIEIKSGKLIFPPITLSTSASNLLMNATYLLCITCDGTFNMWDMNKMQCIITGQSLASILTPGPGVEEVIIKKITLSASGIPMLLLSTGRSFLFSTQINSWVLVGDNADPVTLCSLQRVRQNNIRAIIPDYNKLPLFTLQSYATSTVSNRISQNSDMTDICTITFLEQQIASSVALNSSLEFRYWLLTLVRFLLQHGKLQRLRSICEELLGPLHQHSDSNNTVLGLCKHSLLRDVLKEIGSNINAQRLFTEFNDQLAGISSNCKSKFSNS